MNAIPLERAVLCAGCDTVHGEPAGACPRCTSEQGVLLIRIVGSMEKDDERPCAPIVRLVPRERGAA